MPSRCAPPRSAPCRDVLGRSVHRETVLGSYSRGLPVARETALLTYSLSCAANLPCPRHPMRGCYREDPGRTILTQQSES